MNKFIKVLFLICLCVFVLLVACACGVHEHSGGAATCIEKAVCAECGESYGEIAEHLFENETCARCGKNQYSTGLEYTLNADGVSYSVTGLGACTDTEVLIRAEYEGLPVTRVGYNCFVFCHQIRSVVIPEGVTYIDQNAFDSCRGLLSVTLPSSLTEIHLSAFYNCVRLAEVINHSELDIYTGKSDFGHVAAYAIEVHSGRSKIVELDGYLFYSADGVNYLLDYDEDSTELVLPESYYGENYEIERAFFYNERLTKVTVTGGVTEIGEDAFFNCTKLEEVIIQDGVVSIGLNAFFGCESLTELILPEGVKRIDEYAFGRCLKLKSLSLPNSLEYFGDAALSLDEALEYNEYGGAFYLGNTDNPYVVLVKAKDENIVSCDVHENTKYIASAAFDSCGELSSVTLSEGVKGIGGYAFYDCAGLENIVLPDTVERIGIEAFFGCSSLSEILIGNATSYIGAYAFSGCDSLQGTEYGGAVYIGSNQNPYFALLKAKDTSVSFVEVHPSARIICSSALRQCAELTEITIPDGVTYIGRGAFIGCTSLSSITLPDSIEVVEASLFSHCTSLTSVTLGDNVRQIREFAFMDCEALSVLIFGTSVESVSGIAFEGYYPAFDVYYKGTEEQWKAIIGNGVFRYCEVQYNYVLEK